MTAIHEEHSKSLAELSALLISQSSTDDILQRVAHLAEAMARDCDGVGVTLVVSGEATTAASTAETVREVDSVQYEARRGPCLAAVDQLQAFNVPSVPDESSWPEFRDAAVGRGIMSSLSLPLTFGGLSLGAINLYSHQRNAFDECREAGLLFAAQAGVALGTAQVREGSESLLRELGRVASNGDVVAEAKAILIEKHGCTAEEAVEILRQRSEAC